MVTVENINKINSESIQEILKSPDLTRLVLEIYVDLFNCKRPQFCAKSITEYWNEIKINGLKNLKLKTMSRNYILKRDRLVWDSTTGKHYTYLTITDEIAERMVKLNPRMTNHFENIIHTPDLQPEKKEIKAGLIQVVIEPKKETTPKKPRKKRTPKVKK